MLCSINVAPHQFTVFFKLMLLFYSGHLNHAASIRHDVEVCVTYRVRLLERLRETNKSLIVCLKCCWSSIKSKRLNRHKPFNKIKNRESQKYNEPWPNEAELAALMTAQK